MLIVTDKGLVEAGVVDRVTDELARADINVEVWDEVQPEPPTTSVDACAEAIRQARPAVVLGVGGGSAMDTSQIAACVATNGGMAEDWIGVEVLREPGVPTISVPTTAGTASEVTGNAVVVLPDRSNKMTVVSPFIYPRTALIDPSLTDSVPSHITAATGMDTFCHAAESFIAGRATQHTRQPAADALRRTLEFLPRAVADGTDREARDQMAYACLQAGFSLANAGVILVHGLAHAIGARARIPHGVANTVCLLPVMRLTAERNPTLLADLAAPLGVPADVTDATERGAGRGGGDGAAGRPGGAADPTARGRRATLLAARRSRRNPQQHPRGAQQPGPTRRRRTDGVAGRGVVGGFRAGLGGTRDRRPGVPLRGRRGGGREIWRVFQATWRAFVGAGPGARASGAKANAKGGTLER